MHYRKSPKECITILPIEECELQIKGYICHSNINDPTCHRGVIIYTRQCLNTVDANLLEENYPRDHVYCRILLEDKYQLHVLCIYRSPNSTLDDNDKLNNLIEVASKLKGDLLITGDFN